MNYFSVVTCDKPVIPGGAVTPDVATIEQQATYEVSCNAGHTTVGTSTMTCGGDGQLDQTPHCKSIFVSQFCEIFLALFRAQNTWESRELGIACI